MRFLTQGSEWQNTLNFSINSYIELTLFYFEENVGWVVRKAFQWVERICWNGTGYYWYKIAESAEVEDKHKQIGFCVPEQNEPVNDNDVAAVANKWRKKRQPAAPALCVVAGAFLVIYLFQALNQ